MPVKFNNFKADKPAKYDYVVGYNTASPGGERRWTIQQIAESLAGARTQDAPIQESQYVFKGISARQGSNPSVIWTDTPLTHTITTMDKNSKIRIEAAISSATSDRNHAIMYRIYRIYVAPGGDIVEGVLYPALYNNGQLAEWEEGRGYTPCTVCSNGWTNNAHYSVGSNTRIDYIDSPNQPEGTTVRYTIQWWGWYSDNWLCMNMNSNNPTRDALYVPRTVSTINLTELAGAPDNK